MMFAGFQTSFGWFCMQYMSFVRISMGFTNESFVVHVRVW